MSVHSKFVVHWTGRDFHARNTTITRSIREQYVERLWDDCDKGLVMKPGKETVHGSGGVSITAEIARVCFTEVRLSQAGNHARLYGMLGIGFRREFVLKREGNPVLYVQNGNEGVVVQNLWEVVTALRDRDDKPLIKRLEVVLGYLKGMSHQNEADLEFYEEMEWRIVHLDRLGEYFTPEDASQHLYRVPFKRQDIALIVFPDHETRQMAIEHAKVREFFHEGFPMMTTVDDCTSF